MGKPICELPDVHARDLEQELWRILGETLLDPDYLMTGLQAAHDEHNKSDQIRRDRLAAIDSEIAKHRRRLDALAARIVDVEAGEVFDALMRQLRDIERLIDRMQDERQDLLSVPTYGLTAPEVDEIISFAAKIRDGLDLATDEDRRQLFELLNIRGKDYADPAGIALGRKHRYRIEWRAAFQQLNSSTGFLKREEL